MRLKTAPRAPSSALDDVEREAASRGFLIFVLHVRAGLAHRLDRLVERDVVLAVPPDRHAGGRDRLDRRDRVALDARDLNQTANRVASEAEVVLKPDLGCVLD